MEATGVFNSCVTALMNASCCSLRRISRTMEMVLTTTPKMMIDTSRMPRASRMPVRQLRSTQPTYKIRMTVIRQTPNAI